MMKLSELKTGEQVAAEDARDPEVAAELARTSVANQLAILIIRYRVEHGLTQTALARQLGLKQPAIARLEAGDHEPSVATLARLANKLGITLRLDVEPDSVVLVSAARAVWLDGAVATGSAPPSPRKPLSRPPSDLITMYGLSVPDDLVGEVRRPRRLGDLPLDQRRRADEVEQPRAAAEHQR